MYDKCVALWRDAKDYFQRAAILLGEDFKMPGMWQQFWAAHQEKFERNDSRFSHTIPTTHISEPKKRFFKYLCMAAKVPRAVQLARAATRDGKCVIIGLQSTGKHWRIRNSIRYV